MNDLLLENITKTYKGFLALNQITLTIQPGVFGILGPNGAGKTTLMRILATIISPDSGNISMGPLHWKQPQEVKKVLGYVPQKFGFYPYLTVGEILKHFAILKGLEKEERKAAVLQVLEETHLLQEENKRIKALSGGMLRRLGIAQALLGSPQLLIVDEPTAGLDPEERMRFRNLMANLGKDRIILLSTHIVSDIASICQHAAILNQGKLLLCGSVNEITQTAQNRVREITIREEDMGDWDKKQSVLSYTREENGEIRLRFLGTTEGAPVIPTLEDSYMAAIKGDKGE